MKKEEEEEDFEKNQISQYQYIQMRDEHFFLQRMQFCYTCRPLKYNK